VTKVLLLEKKKSSAARREKLINFSLALWVFYFFSFFCVCVRWGMRQMLMEENMKDQPRWGMART
jgi:uncharacterized membrane protein